MRGGLQMRIEHNKVEETINYLGRRVAETCKQLFYRNGNEENVDRFVGGCLIF